MTEPLRVDIVSDVVCPWCIVGHRQLRAASDATGIGIEVHWHPFELNRDMPDEGENLADHIARKYGSSPSDSAQARARLTAIGEDLGIAFRFSENSRIYNTFQGHLLVNWARKLEREDDMKQALFHAYFTDQKDISDACVLADIADAAGFDRDAAQTVVTRQDETDTVRAHQAFWTSRGVQGVPAMIFDRQSLVTGAQGTGTYARILRQLARDRAA